MKLFPLVFVFCILCITCQRPPSTPTFDPLIYLDPFIGSEAHGHTLASTNRALSSDNLEKFYRPSPAGLIGNENRGQTSDWFSLSALGLYQLCPGNPTFTLNKPLFVGA